MVGRFRPRRTSRGRARRARETALWSWCRPGRPGRPGRFDPERGGRVAGDGRSVPTPQDIAGSSKERARNSPLVVVPTRRAGSFQEARPLAGLPVIVGLPTRSVDPSITCSSIQDSTIMCSGIMARQRTRRDRLQNPRDELTRSLHRVETALSGASAEGFRELFPRVRRAVAASESLVQVLDQLTRQGLRRRGSSSFVSTSEVQDPLQEVREIVGRLANTTPAKFSEDYEQYNQRVRALIGVGRSVLDRGLDPPEGLKGLDEWKPFTEP